MKQLFLGLASLMFALGCASQQSGSLEQGVDAARLRSFHVITSGDRKGDVTNAIHKELERRGYAVTEGSEKDPSVGSADAMVMSTDKWMWDMTMYLIEVKIDLVDPRSGALLGSGRSYRTSLARKSPDYMVKEVFDEIFQTKQTRS